MATVHVRSLAVAAESTFASISASTGLPDNSGLSWALLEFERASVSFDGQTHEANERNEGRASPYFLPPEPVTMYSGGTRVRRRTGTLSVRAALRTIGGATTYANYGSMPLVQLLSSGLGAAVPAGGAKSDAVSAQVASANNTEFTPTTAASYTIGAGFGVDLSGRKEYSFVTDKSGGNVICSPGFSADLDTDSTPRLAETLYSVLGTSTLNASCAVRGDGDGWRFYGYGGRLQSVSVSLENHRVMLDMVVQFTVFQDDHSSYAVSNPTRADGAVAHTLGSYVVITGTIGTTVPAELARVTYGADVWTFKIENKLAAAGHSDDLAGCSNLEVVDATATATVTLSSPSTTFDPYFLNQTQVSVLLGAGPTGAGNGACFYLPAAHLTADASVRDLSGDLVRQTLNFRQGLWALDNSSTKPAGTHARMAFML